VRRRRTNSSFSERLTEAAKALAFSLWAKAVRRPVDTFSLLAAVAASSIIVINALFLQSGAHPAPFFANPKPVQMAAGDAVRSPLLPPTNVAAHPASSALAPPAPEVRRNDPIADLIGPSPRIVAVQHVLSEYGYGQIKPSGMLDQPTSAAIEKFEREHKLPATGMITDRLVGELAAMAGHPVQ